MDRNTEMPKRKLLRMKEYDYSSAGAYFITICIKDRKPILSNIVNSSVGGGALDAPQLQLTTIGKIIERNLLSSENIAGVKKDQYVIMPDHIHAIIFLDPNSYRKPPNRVSTSTTRTNEMLPHIISVFKRFCNKEIHSNIFQRGYMEHIIRDKEDYETRVQYIQRNPGQWHYT